MRHSCPAAAGALWMTPNIHGWCRCPRPVSGPSDRGEAVRIVGQLTGAGRGAASRSAFERDVPLRNRQLAFLMQPLLWHAPPPANHDADALRPDALASLHGEAADRLRSPPLDEGSW